VPELPLRQRRGTDLPRYHVNDIRPALLNWPQYGPGNHSARRTLRVMMTAVLPATSKNSGNAGIESVPNNAFTASAFSECGQPYSETMGRT
jgi:hypothetical protein